jgi:hypothetical protein
MVFCGLVAARAAGTSIVGGTLVDGPAPEAADSSLVPLVEKMCLLRDEHLFERGRVLRTELQFCQEWSKSPAIPRKGRGVWRDFCATPTDPVLDSVFPGGFAAGAVELNRFRDPRA